MRDFCEYFKRSCIGGICSVYPKQDSNDCPHFIDIEKEVSNRLSNIFSEINNIKDVIYEAIRHRHLDTTHDILEAIEDTGVHESYKSFEVHGRQYDVGQILENIETYIYYEIEYQVSKDQWESK